MPRAIRAIGLMSGTSLDGVDAALLETDGEGLLKRGAAISTPYTREERLLLRMALEEAMGWEPDEPMPEVIAEAERHLTFVHVKAVKALLENAGLASHDVDLIGFHGQTVLHQPERRRTVQIGLGDVLANLVGIDVVNDFRAADVAAGGQGAPFVPLYHRALVRNMGLPGTVAVVNVGGVGNVTFIGEEGTLIAFDTGPGNALIDDWAQRHLNETMDANGELARLGDVDEQALAQMMDHPFFLRRPPKSLDRFDFTDEAVTHLSPADGAATLTAFTAAAISRSLLHMPELPRNFIICGGGRHNPVLMEELRARIPSRVVRAEDVDWEGDNIEAEAFAYLAVRSLRGLPLSEPGTTGVPEPMKGGKLHRAGRALA